ncbi:MAG: DUF6671 family protein [Pseudolysinimonas sp.]
MSDSPYRRARFVFATRHGKERQAREPFRRHLQAEVVAPTRIDTDQFGTFTGDIPRTRTQREAALDKALLGILLTGTPYALASEATYRNEFGVTQLDELLLFHDAERGVTLTESVRVAVPPAVAAIVTSPAQALRAASRQGVPALGLVATADTPVGRVIRKGQRHAAQLAVTVGALLTRADEVRLEPDLRAHANPARQQVIARLADRLALRLTRPCPACDSVGWGVVDVERGLPCGLCGEPTAAIRADVYGCAVCGHRATVGRAGADADAAGCAACNP